MDMNPANDNLAYYPDIDAMELDWDALEEATAEEVERVFSRLILVDSRDTGDPWKGK